MAEKKAEAPAEGAEAPKGKKKLMMFIIIGVVVLVLIIGGIVGYLMLKKKPVDEEDPDADPTEEVAKDKKKDKKAKDGHAALPVFHKFDKPFTVKLQGTPEQGDSYLQVEMQFKVLDAAVADQIKAADAEVKHKITITLLGKSAADLASAQGVQRLSNEIRDLANHVLDSDHGGGKKKKAAADTHGGDPADEAAPDAPVQAVLFTTFVIQ